MSIYKSFRTDPEHETKGIRIDYGEDGKFIIRRAGGANKEFAKVLEARTRPYRRQIEMQTMDLKLADKILVETFIDTVLVGWEGITDENGEELVFNKENAVKLLTDLPELFTDLREKSLNAANFLMGDIEGDVKN